MIDWLVAALAVVLVVVIVVVAMLIAGAAAGQTDAHRALGGAVEYKQGRRHNRLCTGGLVIDTLNFVFWRRSAGLSDRQGSPAADELVEAVGEAPRLREALAERMRDCGRAGDFTHAATIVFVAKEVWPPLGEEGWRRVAAAARAGRASLEVAFPVGRDPDRAAGSDDPHGAKGIDDLYAAVRAAELGCVVATNDAYRDFAQVTAIARPGIIWKFDAFADPNAPPTHQHLGAAALSPNRINRLRPIKVRFDDLFGHAETGERALARELTNAAYTARKLAASDPAVGAPAQALADALDVARDRANALADAIDAGIEIVVEA